MGAGAVHPPMTETSRRCLLLVGLLVGAVLVPGCATPQPDADDGADHEVSGTFTRNATQAQMDELANYTRDRGGEIAFLESFPVQFRASNLTEEACGDVRSYAGERAYVDDVGACKVP